MPTHAALACLVMLAGAPALSLAQPPSPPAQPITIDPDRPDVTNGTHIVDTGLLQIEVGGQYTRTSSSERSFGTPFTARVGVFEWLEARIGTDGWLLQADEGGRAAGMGNLQVGAKMRLWADPGGVPVLSILPSVNVPTASADKGLGSGDADYTVAFLTGTDIGRRWHADLNYGLGAIGAGGGQPHFLQQLASLSVSVAATDNWNPYVEVFYFSKQDPSSGAATSIDTGGIYELGARFAIDGGVQFGVSRDAPAFAAFAGFSMIVGDILGNHGVHERARQEAERAARRTPK